MVIATLEKTEILPSYVYFKDVKDLQLIIPKINKKIEPKDGGYAIILQSDVLAKNINLYTEKEGFFSDNYFDMLPGETKTIEFKTQSKTFDINSLKIRSIVDTY